MSQNLNELEAYMKVIKLLFSNHLIEHDLILFISNKAAHKAKNLCYSLPVEQNKNFNTVLYNGLLYNSLLRKNITAGNPDNVVYFYWPSLLYFDFPKTIQKEMDAHESLLTQTTLGTILRLRHGFIFISPKIKNRGRIITSSLWQPFLEDELKKKCGNSITKKGQQDWLQRAGTLLLYKKGKGGFQTDKLTFGNLAMLPLLDELLTQYSASTLNVNECQCDACQKDGCNIYLQHPVADAMKKAILRAIYKYQVIISLYDYCIKYTTEVNLDISNFDRNQLESQLESIQKNRTIQYDLPVCKHIRPMIEIWRNEQKKLSDKWNILLATIIPKETAKELSGWCEMFKLTSFPLYLQTCQEVKWWISEIGTLLKEQVKLVCKV